VAWLAAFRDRIHGLLRAFNDTDGAGEPRGPAGLRAATLITVKPHTTPSAADYTIKA